MPPQSDVKDVKQDLNVMNCDVVKVRLLSIQFHHCITSSSYRQQQRSSLYLHDMLFGLRPNSSCYIHTHTHSLLALYQNKHLDIL